MFAFTWGGPLRLHSGKPTISRVSLAIAATLWFAVVGALAMAWLALPAQRQAFDNAACENLGRAGTQCASGVAQISSAADDCLSFGKGGRVCTK